MNDYYTNEECPYHTYTRIARTCYSNIEDPAVLQNSYLYGGEEMQNDEYDRLVFLFPIIKLEVEKKMLSDELYDELWLYYEDFVLKGLFKDLFKDKQEYEEIEKDLKWCYERKDEVRYKP